MLYVHRWFVSMVGGLSVLLLTHGVAQAVSCDPPANACINNIATTIGENSCNGPSACQDNTGDPIGNNSCDGNHACSDNSGPIGKGNAKDPLGGTRIKRSTNRVKS